MVSQLGLLPQPKPRCPHFYTKVLSTVHNFFSNMYIYLYYIYIYIYIFIYPHTHIYNSLCELFMKQQFSKLCIHVLLHDFNNTHKDYTTTHLILQIYSFKFKFLFKILQYGNDYHLYYLPYKNFMKINTMKAKYFITL